MSTFLTKQMTGKADGEKLFAKIGHWLASPAVRRECGGYPINDGTDYLWIVAMEKRNLRPVGFINFEHKADCIVIHNGYVDAEWRGKGAFRELLRQALSHADHYHLPTQCTVQNSSVEALTRIGFAETGRRGTWIKLERKAT